MSESTESLQPKLTVPGKVFRWAPFVLLASSSIILALAWDSLPERWITHWGAGGQPDGWSTRSFFGVFGVLMLGTVVCIATELTASTMLVMMGGTHASLSASSLAHMRRMMGELVRTFNLGMALIFSLLSMALPFVQPQSPRLIVVTVLPILLGSLGVGMYRWNRDYHRAIAQGEIQPIEGYNGIFYHNPNDPRLMVPKLMGMGTTFNFAHRWAWPLMGLILLFPLLGIILMLAQV